MTFHNNVNSWLICEENIYRFRNFLKIIYSHFLKWHLWNADISSNFFFFHWAKFLQENEFLFLDTTFVLRLCIKPSCCYENKIYDLCLINSLYRTKIYMYLHSSCKIPLEISAKCLYTLCSFAIYPLFLSYMHICREKY